MSALQEQNKARLRHANRVVAILRDEIAAQHRIHALLARQEEHVRAPGAGAFRAATVELEAELGRTPHRASKRNRALGDLAAILGVPARAMTLGSAVERLGDDGAILAQCREELREAANETKRRTVRVSALVRLHREVTRELLQAVLGTNEDQHVLGGGTLIDAEV